MYGCDAISALAVVDAAGHASGEVCGDKRSVELTRMFIDQCRGHRMSSQEPEDERMLALVREDAPRRLPFMRIMMRHDRASK